MLKHRPKTSKDTKRNAMENELSGECYIQLLFDYKLHHVLMEIYVQLEPRDIDNCLLVNSEWNAFIKSNVLGSQYCRKALIPKWRKIIKENWRNPSLMPTETVLEFQNVNHITDHLRFRHIDIKSDAKEIFLGFGSGTVAVMNRRTQSWNLLGPEHLKKAYNGIFPPFGEKGALLNISKDFLVVTRKSNGKPSIAHCDIFERENYTTVQEITSSSNVSSFKKSGELKSPLLVGDKLVLQLQTCALEVFALAVDEAKNKVFKRLHTLVGHAGGTTVMDGSGDILLSASYADKNLRVWNLKTGFLVETIQKGYPIKLISVCGQRYAIPYAQYAINIHDLNTHDRLKTCTLDVDFCYLKQLELFPDKLFISSLQNQRHIRQPKVTIQWCDLEDEGSLHTRSWSNLVKEKRSLNTRSGSRPAYFSAEMDRLLFVNGNGRVVVQDFWKTEKKKKDIRKRSGRNHQFVLL